MADAWRSAGGGNGEFSPVSFGESFRSGPLTAGSRCDADCGGRLPGSCWWAAVGAEVRRLRPGRKQRAETGQGALF
jgi:hypothetical protein